MDSLTDDEQAEVLRRESGRVGVDLSPVGRSVLAPVQLQQLFHHRRVNRHLLLSR